MIPRPGPPPVVFAPPPPPSYLVQEQAPIYLDGGDYGDYGDESVDTGPQYFTDAPIMAGFRDDIGAGKLGRIGYGPSIGARTTINYPL